MTGSGVRSAIGAANGDMAEVERLGKAMGRATGSAVQVGGLLDNVPVFPELATVGDSLGDVFAGGDTDRSGVRSCTAT